MPGYLSTYTRNLGCFTYILLIYKERHTENRLFLLRILVRADYFIPQPYILYT